MQKIINFLRGAVRLELAGAFPERFLNLCAVENLPFWGAEQTDAHTLRVTVALQDRSRAEELARRAMCRAEEAGRFGLPAFLSRFRKRYALLAGLALSLLVLCVLSNFVLVIDISGNRRVSEGQIRGALDRAGLRVGAYGPGIRERELVNRALLELDEVGFLTVRVNGVRAEVVVREKPEKPEIADRSRPADVVAVRDGLILSVGAKEGEKQVQAGDAVLRGEVLISGLVTHQDGVTEQVRSSRQVRAEGVVWAITRRTLRRSIPLSGSGRGAVKGVRSRYALRLGRRRINFYRNGSFSGENYATINREYKLTLPGSRTLPLAWLETEVTDRETGRVKLKQGTAEAYLKERLAETLRRELADGTALSREWRTERRDGVLTVTLKAECREQIGRTLELTGTEEASEHGR